MEKYYTTYPYGDIYRTYTLGGYADQKIGHRAEPPQDAVQRCTGKERDVETGLHYFGARYYDSDLGRWLQVDPLADKYPGWSPYNYCVNNPVRMVDPDGRFTITNGIYRFQTVERYNWYFALKFIPGVRYIYNSDDHASKDPNRTVSWWDWIPFELLGIAEQFVESAVFSGIVSNFGRINNGYGLAGYDPTKSIGDQLIANYLVNATVWSNSKQTWIKAAEYVVIQSNGKVVYDELNLNPQYFLEIGVLNTDPRLGDVDKNGKVTNQGWNKVNQYLDKTVRNEVMKPSSIWRRNYEAKSK